MSSLLKYVEFDDINIIRENVKSSLDTLPLAQKLLYKYEFIFSWYFIIFLNRSRLCQKHTQVHNRCNSTPNNYYA